MSSLWGFDPSIERPDQPLIDFDVSATDKSIGTVVSTFEDDDLAFLVVQKGGVLTKKQVVIPAGLVKQINADAAKVFLRVDKESVADAPEYDEDWRLDPAWRDRVTSHFPQQTR